MVIAMVVARWLLIVFLGGCYGVARWFLMVLLGSC